MIEGVVSNDGTPLVTLTLAGRDCPMVVDTGFNGCLELPEEFRELIPKVSMGPVRSELASGIVIDEESFLVRVYFDGQQVMAPVTFAPVIKGLIGTELLADHRLEIDFPKATVRLTWATDSRSTHP